MQVNISDATKGLNGHSYNPLTVASLDLGELIVDKFFECEKRDEWTSVKGNGFLRLAALDFPAYGRAFIKSAAFFVPYYQILQNVDGLRQGLASDKGQPCILPQITTNYLNEVLDDVSGLALATLVGETTNPNDNLFNTPHDFIHVVKESTDTTKFRLLNLTEHGKRIYKVAKMCGLDFRSYSKNTSYSAQIAAASSVNVLNLLCYVKIYTDYFLNIHLYNTSPIVALLKAIKDGQNYDYSPGVNWYNASNGYLTTLGFINLLEAVRVPFSSTLYTDAWNTVNSPTGTNNYVTNFGSFGPIGPYLPQGTYVTDELTNTVNSTIIKSSSNNSLSYLTEQGLLTLESFFKFVRRNNLFGSEPARTALARFGIKGDDFNTYFARKLYENSQQIDFSAVMSNANTVQSGSSDGSVLGAYGGVGLGSFNFDYNYKCSDYGLIMNLSWIQIDPLQVHGFDPSVLRKKQFDWWTPEYDGKASRAIPQMELSISDLPVDATYNVQDADIFGFIGIYDEYRRMRDTVLGDFVFGNAQNFVFARDLSKYRRSARQNMVPQSQSIQSYRNDTSDPSLTDPFQFASSNGDRFYLMISWNINAQRPILSAGDSLQLNGSGDIQESTNSSPMS